MSVVLGMLVGVVNVRVLINVISGYGLLVFWIKIGDVCIFFFMFMFCYWMFLI